jgi:hypothetical protein
MALLAAGLLPALVFALAAESKLPERILQYLEADPADRPALMLEDADGLVPVTLTFDGEPDAVVLSGLEEAGVHFYVTHHGILHYGPFYPARGDEGGLLAIGAAPAVSRVTAPSMQAPRPPLDWTRVDIGAEPAWYAAGEPWPLTGSGVTVADIDSGIEPFHPIFYRPDAGYFSWTDVDGDGLFAPGTDGVDLDGDGAITDVETVELVDAAAWRLYTWPPAPLEGLGYDGIFTPGLDWLYLDMNGNGRRDFGYNPDDPDFPVTEETPAYGEPLFVADDIDGSGTLDPGEKLIRLGTCKIRAAVLGPGLNEYVRGENLVEYAGAGSNWETAHATMALSIVGGGAAGLTRFAGIAPDAELLIASYTNLDYMVCLTWALEQEPDIVLHEAGSWVDQFLDGSSDDEQAMDLSASEDGVIHINPSGNLGGSDKHARVDVPAGETAEAGFTIPDWEGMTFYWTMMSLLWRRTEAGLRFEMCSPEGLCGDFTSTGPSGTTIWDDTLYVLSTAATSPRGTRKLTTFFGDYAGREPIPTGAWRLRIINESSADVTVHVYVTDNFQDWTYGAFFEDPYATDLYTVTNPGTADSAINVSAYAGHGEEDWGDPVKRGSYRWYSSQGPRIDEVAIMDVAAPDNPITAAPPAVDGMSWGSYLEFGGTSGAGPHVAGGAALILQADPGLTGDLMREVMRESALVDEDVGAVPSDQWGWGKFRVDRAVLGEPAPPNEPPTLSLRPPESAFTGEPAIITPEAQDPDGDESAIEIRWDVEYDGTWDTDWALVGTFGNVYEEPGPVQVKAMVRDELGLSAQAVCAFEVLARPEPEEVPEEAVEEPADPSGPEEGGGDEEGAETPPGLDVAGGGCACVMGAK